MSNFTSLKNCLCCGSGELEPYAHLGAQPLANNLIKRRREDYHEFPLTVNYCKKCWHSQLSLSVDPKLLFKNYFYLTGKSQTMHDYCGALANKIYNLFKRKCSILDVASNDGTLLEKFKKYNWRLRGVEPAANIAALSRQKGIQTHCKFFGVEKIELDQKFEVITALNVLAHVSSPLQFLLESKKHLTPDGIIVVQTSQRNMVEERQFDTIYHEHLSFFSINSMKALCERAGLNLFRVEGPRVHGKSYVFYLAPKKAPDKSVGQYLGMETTRGRYKGETYSLYQEDIEKFRSNAIKILKNKRLVGFGAAAKGIVFLNFLGSSDVVLEGVIDETGFKQNKIIPKLNIPIKPLEFLEEIRATDPLVVVLPWNCWDEICKKVTPLNAVRFFPHIEYHK